MKTDKYIRAYDKARHQGVLDHIAAAVGCPVTALAHYRSCRRIAGHKRSTEIRQAFISYGCIDKTTPISDLFPRWSSLFKFRKITASRSHRSYENSMHRVPGSLADLWLDWLEDGTLTVQTIRDDVMRDCGLAGTESALSSRMMHHCEVFLYHAGRVAD